MKCSVCSSPRRKEIEADLLAGLSFRVIAKRNSVDKSSAYRHAKHWNADFTDDGASGSNTHDFDFDSAAKDATKAWARAASRHDVRGMGLAMDLLLKVGHFRTQQTETSTEDLRTMTDAQLELRSIEYETIIYADRVEEWIEHARTVTDALNARKQLVQAALGTPAERALITT